MASDFTRGEIRVLSDTASEWARKHPEFYFSERSSRREQIERHLVDGACAVGADDATLIRCGEWSVVGSAHDWFIDRRIPLPDDLDFENMPASPELGQNSTPAEFVIAAFAAGIVVHDRHGTRVIRDDSRAPAAVHDLIAGHPQWTRAIAFALTES